MEQFNLKKMAISQRFGALESHVFECEPFSYRSFKTAEQNHYFRNINFATSSLYHSVTAACVTVLLPFKFAPKINLKHCATIQFPRPLTTCQSPPSTLPLPS